MPDKRQHRGPHPEDAKLFATAQVPALQAATSDLSWLFERGYAATSALKLVGDRYGLTARQRTAVARCACTARQRQRRLEHRVSPDDLTGSTLWIDGYNVLTSIEAALAGGVLIRGRDGCLRDMASMHGSYRRVEETIPALTLLGEQFSTWRISHCRWLLDEPVSNSGRLRSLMEQTAAARNWPWDIDLVPDPDPILATADSCVATADSEILDNAARWLNVVDRVVAAHVPAPWIVDLSESNGDTDRSGD